MPFTITLAALVFAMALSFLGVWEIPIPGFVGSGVTAEVASREGAAGAFAKGVVTTVLATPCSGPYLGTVFGFTVGQPPAITYLVFATIGLGMASPYLVIGAFPRLVRFLPKPGAWMDTFKQLMGFVLLGTVVFLFTAINRDYFIPTFALLIGIWAACWWIGRMPFTLSPGRRLLAWLEGAVVTAVVGSFAFTWLVPHPNVLPWQPFSRSALDQLTGQGKTVLVDFTANWCLTCQFNLKNAIDTEAVRKLVEANGVVPLLADWSNPDADVRRDPADAARSQQQRHSAAGHLSGRPAEQGLGPAGDHQPASTARRPGRGRSLASHRWRKLRRPINRGLPSRSAPGDSRALGFAASRPNAVRSSRAARGAFLNPAEAGTGTPSYGAQSTPRSPASTRPIGQLSTPQSAS